MQIRSGVRYFKEWLLVKKNQPVGSAICAAYAICATAVFTYLLAADIALIAFGANLFPPSSPAWPSEAFNCLVVCVAPSHAVEMLRIVKRKAISFADAIRRIVIS